MKTQLFSEFQPISTAQWKQQIQFELKGADYNESLVWESLEGIKVKPFYHTDEAIKPLNLPTRASEFKILQDIFVHDVLKSNQKAINTLNRGAESIRFILDKSININDLMQNLPTNTPYFFTLQFLDGNFIQKLNNFSEKKQYLFNICIDAIHKLAKEGNWFNNLEDDFAQLSAIPSITICINASLYQNAGATMVQQLAYALAHLHEYLGRLENINKINIQISVGSHYFFEIAKLRALRLLINTLVAEYHPNIDINIIAFPTLRNKTLYDYNVNMLRTTTECMTAILGGADYICNLPYDYLYHKTNEFSDRIARNQLLILKHESYFDKVDNPAEGSYYIENITQQLAEKALDLFKDIEKNGGFITQLTNGTIQRKIVESAEKEQNLFDTGTEVLLGTNKYPNKNDQIKHELELYPFVKQNTRKTLITPIITKRLAEKIEKERLATE